ncbi:MAG: type II toxin-antitoxin system VapC family toxin [Candidatus Nitrospinota bacterium M3_3B_026]
MSECVLDASALLALLNGEAGSDRVEEVIPEAYVSSVNVSEVVAKLMDNGAPEDAVREALLTLGVDIVDFNEEMAFEAGKLRPVTRKHGLSLGDRACLATAKVLNLPAVTTDRTWLKLKTKIKMRCVR